MKFIGYVKYYYIDNNDEIRIFFNVGVIIALFTVVKSNALNPIEAYLGLPNFLKLLNPSISSDFLRDE